MDHICSFCSKKFYNKSSLTLHQTTAKFCLKLQNKTNDIFTCCHCKTVFTRKCNLDKHESACTSSMDVELNEKDTEIERLREFYESELAEQISQNKEFRNESVRKLEESTRTFEEQIKGLKHQLLEKEHDNRANEAMTEYTYKQQLAEKDKENAILKSNVDLLQGQINHLQDKLSERPNNTIGTSVNNLTFVLSKETIEQTVNTKFTREYVIGGRPAIQVADFIYKHIAVDQDGNMLYKCTDGARKKFEYKTPDGSTVVDVGASKLLKLLLPFINKRAHVLLREIERERDDCESELRNMRHNDYNQDKYKKMLSNLACYAGTSLGFCHDMPNFMGPKYVGELIKVLR